LPGYDIRLRTGRKVAKMNGMQLVETFSQKLIVKHFHRFFYDSHAFSKTYWLGVQTLKCPLDLWIYQEIIHELRPDVIVETGTLGGGSALFLASMCDLMNKGQVLTIDIQERESQPQHARIQYLHGSSTSSAMAARVKNIIKKSDVVMVILDSDHRKQHVLDELRIYSNIVTKGSFLIVEDTNLNGHPVRPDFGPGPLEAVKEFLRENDCFLVEETRQKFHLTFNPNGYLRRIK
jgi:cephalosporin hydroxylase